MAKWHGKQYSRKGLRRYPKYNPVYRKLQRFGAGASGAALGFIGGNLPGAVGGWFGGRKLYDMKYPQRYKKRVLSSATRKYGTIGSNPPGPVLGTPGRFPKKGKGIIPFWPKHKRAHVTKYFLS